MLLIIFFWKRRLIIRRRVFVFSLCFELLRCFLTFDWCLACLDFWNRFARYFARLLFCYFRFSRRRDLNLSRRDCILSRRRNWSFNAFHFCLFWNFLSDRHRETLIVQYIIIDWINQLRFKSQTLLNLRIHIYLLREKIWKHIFRIRKLWFAFHITSHFIVEILDHISSLRFLIAFEN